MIENANGKPRHDHQTYVENRKKFTYEQLLPYAGQWVAWSVDGSRIVAHHDDLQELVRMIDAAGVDREDVILDLRPPADVDSLLCVFASPTRPISSPTRW